MQGYYLKLGVTDGSVPQRLPRTLLDLVFFFHLACRQVSVVPGRRPLDCLQLRSLCYRCFTVSKIRFIDPHPMHDNGELARHRGGGWLESVTLCQPDTPCLEATPFPATR